MAGEERHALESVSPYIHNHNLEGALPQVIVIHLGENDLGMGPFYSWSLPSFMT